MSDILSDIQTYELIEPYLGFKPQWPIASIEVQPVREEDGHCSLCEIGNEHFWSVYVRYARQSPRGFGGVDCVADCSNFTGAAKLADLLGSLLGVEIVGV